MHVFSWRTITTLFMLVTHSGFSVADSTISHDGLLLKSKSKHKVVYVKPTADFGQYEKIRLLPVHVAFKHNWQKDYNRGRVDSRARIKDPDVLRIKKDVAALFNNIFKSEFIENNYAVAENNGPDILLIRPALIDLNIVSPDLRSATNVKVFNKSAGSVTLYIELYDSVSGEILARVAESKSTGNQHSYGWANRVTNTRDARIILASWAKQLRKYLDSAHKKGAFKAP